MLKIAYLHGLESNNIGPKNDWLQHIAIVYDPQINYHEKHIFQKILLEIKTFDPNLIIGSSMGGFFAYEIAKMLNIKAVLFNPALHSRSMNPDMDGLRSGKNKPATIFILGKSDEIIDPKVTLKINALEKNENVSTKILDHGHGTPFDVFQNEISDFITSNFENKVK